MHIELTWAEAIQEVAKCICVVIAGCTVGFAVGFLVRIALEWVKEITKEDSRD